LQVKRKITKISVVIADVLIEIRSGHLWNKNQRHYFFFLTKFMGKKGKGAPLYRH